MRGRRADTWGQRRLAPLVWLLWACASGAVLGGSALILASSTQVPDSRRFPGLLRPVADPISVVLPANVPLEAVLVSEGAEVRVGQTLATLDKAALTEQLAEIATKIQERTALYQCLMDGTGLDPEGQPDVTVLEGSDADSAPALRLRSALADCALERRSLAETRAGLADARRLLAARRDLLNQRIALALDPADPPAPPPVIETPPSIFLKVKPEAPPDTGPPLDPTDNAQTVVALALARSVLEEQLLELRRAAEVQAHTAETAMLTRTRDLVRDVEHLSAEHARLSRHARVPRMTAAQAGTVTAVRSVKPGTVFPETAELIAIVPAPGAGVQVLVALPAAHAVLMDSGDPVLVHLPSQLNPGPPLLARVGHSIALPPDLGGPGLVGREVELDTPTALDLAQSGLALRGRSTSATVELRLPGLSLAEALRRGGWRLAKDTAVMRWSARITQAWTPPAAPDPTPALRLAAPPGADWRTAPL